MVGAAVVVGANVVGAADVVAGRAVEEGDELAGVDVGGSDERGPLANRAASGSGEHAEANRATTARARPSFTSP